MEDLWMTVCRGVSLNSKPDRRCGFDQLGTPHRCSPRFIPTLRAFMRAHSYGYGPLAYDLSKNLSGGVKNGNFWNFNLPKTVVSGLQTLFFFFLQ